MLLFRHSSGKMMGILLTVKLEQRINQVIFFNLSHKWHLLFSFCSVGSWKFTWNANNSIFRAPKRFSFFKMKLVAIAILPRIKN